MSDAEEAPGWDYKIVGNPEFYAIPSGVIQREAWVDLLKRIEALEKEISHGKTHDSSA